MRKYLAPFVTGLSFLFIIVSYQNCAELDPSYVFDGIEQKKIAPDDSILEISNLKLNRSEIVDTGSNLIYYLDADFRVKYSNHFLGLDVRLLKDFVELKQDDTQLIQLDANAIEVSRKDCFESIDKEGRTFFDCSYVITSRQSFDRNLNLSTHSTYRLASEGGEILLGIQNYDKVVGVKNFEIEASFSEVRPIKKQAKKPSKKINKIVKQQIKKKPVVKVLPAPVEEGIYCHIQILNPPLLDLLSDVKKTGTHYEDRDNCRNTAIELSKTYCEQAVIGEIDYDFKIKYRNARGEKILKQEINSVDCDAFLRKKEIAANF